ncbi:MAG: DUF7344 domain-containing protein [Halobacteriota archaeon]|uniref:DUF7344 domain-containing protein n=1 Tax=Natronomonas sp. TaxID=2184060 RepID=UPI0039761E9A
MKSIDDIFSLFGSERRRFALYYLKHANGSVSIDELAEEIYTWEESESNEEIPSDEFRRVILTLEHNHLPKIEGATHVEYDRTNDRLRITGLSAEADVLLSVTEAMEQPSRADDFVLGRLGKP